MIDCAALAASLDNVTILDLRSADDCALGYIEGSKHLDLYQVRLTNSALEPLETFLSMFPGLFGSRGVSRERPVVVCDYQSCARASPALWLLAVLGHPNARLLDGGSGAWVEPGRKLVHVGEAAAPVAREKGPPTPPLFQAGRRVEILATRFDVTRAIDD